MDLDSIKKVWQEQKTASFSREEILKMLQKKSSSVAKWIFYIGIAEFVFWLLLSILLPENDVELGAETLEFINILTYLNYAVIGIFILFFFRNYQKVKATQSVNKLLQSIFKVRKTVRYYIIYNLTMFVFMIFSTTGFLLIHENSALKISESMKQSSIFWGIFTISLVLLTGFLATALYFFYKLLYGFLLRRLQQNYDEIVDLQ